MTSLSSCVLIDILAMCASGLRMLIPAFSDVGDTEPKKSTTPTCPAGTTVKHCDRATTPANATTAIGAPTSAWPIGLRPKAADRPADRRAKRAKRATATDSTNTMATSPAGAAASPRGRPACTIVRCREEPGRPWFGAAPFLTT